MYEVVQRVFQGVLVRPGVFKGVCGVPRPVHRMHAASRTCALVRGFSPSVDETHTPKVHGFELNASAVADAKRNAADNGIANATFHLGDLSKAAIAQLSAVPSPETHALVTVLEVGGA